ncbi:uncharacterized protein LOC110634525 isoform X2 [Hevea brasiliensis]|uniref:uncharacterized protein LOC110634525 isoform X2 n=1 Tax=Hevea brasiliensis TaxID=3981 RepID=UPI0025CE13EF|nr:uncharacterized protein LOC110634525 isoform X2 [Hevea brasiliensis]
MARNERAGGEAMPPSSSSSRLRAGIDPFLVVCRCFSFVTTLTAILCIAVNVLSAIRSAREGFDVLEYWAGRSMLQILVAVMTRALPDYSASQKDLILLQNIPSYLLLACGVVYVVSAREFYILAFSNEHANY